MAIVFYQKDVTVYAVHYKTSENPLDVSKLEWLFSGAKKSVAVSWKVSLSVREGK